MIISDGYTIRQERTKNRIVITLPQTWQTLQNTVTPISYRKTELTESEEALLLNVVRQMFDANMRGEE